MFSGLVEELGTVLSNRIERDGRLGIGASTVLEGTVVGDSVAVNGCCLTVVALHSAGFEVDVMPESSRRTSLGSLREGDHVNLERSLALGDRIGGHLVTGHVDATATVIETRPDGNAHRVGIGLPGSLAGQVVGQGSVAVDGISLTVVAVGEAMFTVSLIPHTLAVTTARGWAPGSVVNLEGDLLAKYVLRGLALRGDPAPGAKTVP